MKAMKLVLFVCFFLIPIFSHSATIHFLVANETMISKRVYDELLDSRYYSYIGKYLLEDSSPGIDGVKDGEYVIRWLVSKENSFSNIVYFGYIGIYKMSTINNRREYLLRNCLTVIYTNPESLIMYCKNSILGWIKDGFVTY